MLSYPRLSLCVCQQEKEYLKGCTFLPRVNNEQMRKEPSVKQRIAKLNRLALVMVRSNTAASCCLDGAQAGNTVGSTICGSVKVTAQLSYQSSCLAEHASHVASSPARS